MFQKIPHPRMLRLNRYLQVKRGIIKARNPQVAQIRIGIGEAPVEAYQ